MTSSRTAKQRYNFLLDKQVYDDFSLLCSELGLVRGKNLEIYMKKFIEENKATLSQINGGKKQ